MGRASWDGEARLGLITSVDEGDFTVSDGEGNSLLDGRSRSEEGEKNASHLERLCPGALFT